MTDMIKRDDALALLNSWTYCCDAEDAVRALPAVTVGVKPLVWDGVQGDCFIECETVIGTYALQVSDSLERECDWEWSATYRKHGQREITIGQGKFQAAKDITQADYEARILAVLELVAAPDPAATREAALVSAVAKQIGEEHGWVRREELEAAEAKLAKAVEALVQLERIVGDILGAHLQDSESRDKAIDLIKTTLAELEGK